MNGMKAALVVVTGIALAACQRTPEKKAADANALTLEQRIAALEQQAPPSTAAPADPAGLALSPEPAAGSSYVDNEGAVVWVLEYLRYRLNRCSHGDATTRVFQQPLDQSLELRYVVWMDASKIRWAEEFFRFVPRFGHELDVIRQAHRVRGAHGGRGPFAAVARWGGYVVPLLAGAIRHAERVALAMDARAFGAYPDRTERHLVPFRARDIVFVALFLATTAAIFWLFFPWGLG